MFSPSVSIDRGRGCARPGIPGVYARVSAALDWIYSIMCFHSYYPPTKEEGICQQIEQPPVTLHVSIHYNKTAIGAADKSNNPDNNTPISWGLYHIDSQTTVYQTQLMEGEMGQRRALTSMGNNVHETVEKSVYVFQSAGDGMTWQFTNLVPGTYAFDLRDHNTSCVTKVKITQESHHPVDWIDEEGPFDSSFYHRYFTVAKLPIYNTNDHVNKEFDSQVQTKPASTIPLKVEIFYDNAATDNSWMLSRRENSKSSGSSNKKYTYRSVVYISPRFSVRSSQLVSTTLEILQNNDDIYEFALFDAGRNGICCRNGVGWVTIWLGSKMVFLSDGRFETKLSTTIDMSSFDVR